MQAKLDHKCIAYFDNLGFECVIDITNAERKQLMQTLKGEEITAAFNVNAMMLRARFNPQRSPEIWIFESNVDEATLRELAESSPQMLADLIRAHGSSIYTSTKIEQKIR
jgi:hypothetical protein